jgi:hypothetical protein
MSNRTVTILITRVKNYRFVNESCWASIDTRRESCVLVGDAESADNKKMSIE